MALTLVARESGEDLAKSIQLGIEYDPQPQPIYDFKMRTFNAKTQRREDAKKSEGVDGLLSLRLRVPASLR